MRSIEQTGVNRKIEKKFSNKFNERKKKNRKEPKELKIEKNDSEF